VAGAGLRESPRRAPGARQGEDDLSDARILLIEANDTVRAEIADHLRHSGFPGVRSVADHHDGLRVALAWGPELVITGTASLDRDGFSLCGRLRSDPRFRHVPIIARTAASDRTARARVFAAGATDLLIDPIDPTELASRVRTHLENRRLLDRLSGYKRRMAEEIEVARAMQVSLMPGPVRLADLGRRRPIAIAAVHEASSGLSGDLWGLTETPGGRIRVFTADFVGHGVGSALNTFRLHAFLESGAFSGDGPADWLSAVNGFLCDVLPVGQFATICCVELDLDAGRAVVASGAAPRPAISSGAGFALVDVSGLPLGITPDSRYRAVDLPFPPGSGLLLYSDAVIETPDAAAPDLSPADLVAELDAGGASRTPAETCARIRDLVMTAGRDRLADDLTLVMIHHRRDTP
jgi:sigma-B regulation protein RsbU (phosphoserine phosphatase)